MVSAMGAAWLVACILPGLVMTQTTTTPASFVGWFYDQGLSVTGTSRTTAMNCKETEEFTLSGSWGACCESGIKPRCPMNTGCTSGTLYRDQGDPIRCPQECIKITMYPDPQQSDPTGWYFCGGGAWSAHTVWRNLLASQTSSFITTTSAPTTTGTAPSSTNSDPKPAKDRSKAWIAGVAVGAAALIAVAAFWWRLRTKRNQAPSHNMAPDTRGSIAPMTHSYVSDAVSPGLTELGANPRPHELESNYYIVRKEVPQPSELPAPTHARAP